MNRDAARLEIRSRISCKNYLKKSKSGLYCCPLCGSGTGQHATGAVKYYEETNTWYCHSCGNEQLQGKGGDVIDLYQIQNNADYNTALHALAAEIGIEIEKGAWPEDRTTNHRKKDRVEGEYSAFSKKKGINIPQNEKAAEIAPDAATEPNADFTDYYKRCRENIHAPEAVEYLKSRGIGIETAEKYWIGFDPAADPAGTGFPCARIIIPASASFYVARRIDGNPERRYMNPAGSRFAIFNLRALEKQEAQEVFITEGAFDALSLLEVGADAIALNSAKNATNLLKILEEKRPAASFILCLDNDEIGQGAEAILRQGLQRLNIPFISANISGEYKDPNEALVKDPKAFINAVDQAIIQADKPDTTKQYIDLFMGKDIAAFSQDKKTGFTDFDNKSGGLYSGLYVLAAISSLGKTSFALQLADQLAERGNDVIYFSLEQSRLELVSKSIARRAMQNGENITSLEIRKGKKPEIVKKAAAEYMAAVSYRESIVEANLACDVSFIGEYLRKYIRQNGVKPVVFIDYLQILQPSANGRTQSARESIDTTVTELKRISREMDLTIFAISSVNRTNYLTPIDFESLKESGGIEFTADVVFGLQLQCLRDPLFDQEKKIAEKREKVRKAKAADPREIELTCLKNRYGISSYSCYFKYYPAHDLFVEAPEPDREFTEYKEGASWITI